VGAALAAAGALPLARAARRSSRRGAADLVGPAGRRRERQDRLRGGRWASTAVRELSKEEQDEDVSKATPPSGSGRILEVQHEGKTCVLLEWKAEKQFETIDAWLEEWKYGGEGGGAGAKEAKFWRQRTLMAMQQKLQKLAFDPDGGRRGDGGVEIQLRRGEDVLVSGGGQAKLRVFGLHPEEDLSGPPLAVAFALERPFALSSFGAFHIEQLVKRPPSRSTEGEAPVESFLQKAGAALVNALAAYAVKEDKVLTVEPQSKALEGYFGKLGFRNSEAIDKFVWFMAGAPAVPGEPSSDGPISTTVGLRYVLASEQDYDRLLIAFKRAPLWLARSEEAFFTARADTAAKNVVSVRVARIETLALAKACVRRYQRAGTGGDYTAGVPLDIEVNGAMSVMRTPVAMDMLDWAETVGLRNAGEEHGQYLVLGRCTVAQRAFPMPGLTKYGIELVVDACELPLKSDPVYSISAEVPLSLAANAAECIRLLFETMRVRAALQRNSRLWSLELVLTDGLAALTMEMPPLVEEEDEDIF